jgi:hypothetical protein
MPIFLPVSAALFCFIVPSAFDFKRFSSISASVVANLLQPLYSPLFYFY